ncbi:hypothetical protein BDY21DRAFT_177028 [Lineolata rhizophorae]|uniref:Uncharacterized protein n=1 Tax=Lineolata rhizophorae TaxID=578093 RepID=A0A6A6P6X3_9PEZI|nr:hypothetical protein BDY21DRAFT_177028 [Lineolata rhizophorae]
MSGGGSSTSQRRLKRAYSVACGWTTLELRRKFLSSRGGRLDCIHACPADRRIRVESGEVANEAASRSRCDVFRSYCESRNPAQLAEAESSFWKRSPRAGNQVWLADGQLSPALPRARLSPRPTYILETHANPRCDTCINHLLPQSKNTLPAYDAVSIRCTILFAESDLPPQCSWDGAAALARVA